MKIHCEFKELVETLKIKPYPKNRNKHSKEQIERLAKLIQHHGFRHPIIVSNLSGCIIAGHGRWEAAKLLKLDKIPVDYQDFENEDAEYLFSVSDNAISEWSELDLSAINIDIPDIGPFDIDLLGLKDFSVEPLDKFIPGCDEDEIPQPKETICKKGDLWQLGKHRLLCADSTQITDVEKLMNGEKADMIFTDPPYGINENTDRDFASRTRLAKGGIFDKIINDNNTDCAIDAWNLCKSLNIKYSIFWGANHYASKIESSPSWIVWDKRVEEKEHDFNSDCELAWCNGYNKSVRIFRHKWKGLIKESEHGEKRIHPTQKPIALAEWCFENYGNPNIVLDLFLGSGSTLIACEKTNRICYGIEIDPHYCSVIIERWEKYSGKKAELING